MKKCLLTSLTFSCLLTLSNCKEQKAAEHRQDTSEQNTRQPTTVGDIEFKCSSFCFVRIWYSSGYGGDYGESKYRPYRLGKEYRGGYRGGGRWATDYHNLIP